jgi:two-component system sensor histidine kinase DegS
MEKPNTTASVKTELDVWTAVKSQLQSELDQYRRELKEISLMLEQSQLEVNKLAQRNASITAHMQQVQAQFESLPRAELRITYESALDAQQRLYVLRSQVEKLQNDQNHLNRYIAMAEQVLKAFDSGAPKEGRGRSSLATSEMVERMIQAQEAERLKLSRQMHDGPAQALSNFILQTEIAIRLFDLDQSKAKEELANMKISAAGTFQRVRDFIFELRPMMLDDLGLSPTLKRYIDNYKEQSRMDVRLTVSGMDRRLESYQEVMIFRGIQELLNNAIRHSQATQVKVQMDMADASVKVTVEDNGKGFDVETLQEKGTMGLKLIRERVDLVGGYMDIDSVPGQGTRVIFQIPLSGSK